MAEPQPQPPAADAAPAAPAASDAAMLKHKQLAWLRSQFAKPHDGSDDSDSSAASTAPAPAPAAVADAAESTEAETVAAPKKKKSPKKKRSEAKKATKKTPKMRPSKKKTSKKRAASSSSSSESESEARGRQKARRPKKAPKEKHRRRKPAASDSSGSSSDSSSSSGSNDSNDSSSDSDAQAETRIASARRREISSKERNDHHVHGGGKQRGGEQRAKASKRRPELPDAKRIKLQLSRDSESGEVEYRVDKQRPSSATRKRPLPGTTPRGEEKAAAKRQSADGEAAAAAHGGGSKSSSAASPGKRKDRAVREEVEPTAAKPETQLKQEERDLAIAMTISSERPKRRSASEDMLDGTKKEEKPPANELAKKRKHVEATLTDTIVEFVSMGTAAPARQKVAKKSRAASVESVEAATDNRDAKQTKESSRPAKKSRNASSGSASPKRRRSPAAAAAITTPRSLARAEAKSSTPPRPRSASKPRRATDEAAAEDGAKPKAETPRAVKKVRESGDGASPSPRAVESATSSSKAASSASPKRVRRPSERGREASRAAEEKSKPPRIAALVKDGDSSAARVSVKKQLTADAVAKDELRVKKAKRKATDAEAPSKQTAKLKREQRDETTGKSDRHSAVPNGAKSDITRRPKPNSDSTASSDAGTKLAKAERRHRDAQNDAKGERMPDKADEDKAVTVTRSPADQQRQPKQTSENAATQEAPDTTSGEITAPAVVEDQQPQEPPPTDQASEARGVSGGAPVPSKDEREEGEEGEEVEEGAKPSQPVALANASSSTAEASKPGDALPDLLSFVIPKKKIVRTESRGLSRAPAASALPPTGNGSLRRTPASSPLPRESDANGGSAGGSQPPHADHAPPRRRRRTKNPVPVAATALSREEISFMRLARKVNSFFEVCEKIRATPDSHARSTAGRYGVVDADGKVVADFLPRMKCPTKKQMKTQTEQYPAPFFGVAMSLPSDDASTAAADVGTQSAAVNGEETSADGSEARKVSEMLETEINIYEPLVFERTEDRDVYQRKMYGTTFVPQLLRGRTTLIMRNVRYERKSIGFQFNTDRDREDFAKSLGERYALNDSVPRGDIPLKNWQQLLKKMPAVVYLHYANSEDAELAVQRFVDDNGVPLERKRTNRVGGAISTSTPSSPAPPAAPRRSRSTERESSSVAPKSGDLVSDRNEDAGRGDGAGASRDRSREREAESSSRDSNMESRNRQPSRDEQRASERRVDRYDSDAGQGARDWPPPRAYDRTQDRDQDRGGGGGGFASSGRDRRMDRYGGGRGDSRYSDQRYGLGGAGAHSNGGEHHMPHHRQRDERPRDSRSPARSRYGAMQRGGSEESDPSHWPPGRSDEGDRRDPAAYAAQEDSQSSANANAAEGKSRSQDAESDSFRDRQQSEPQEPQRPVRASLENGEVGRSPGSGTLDDRSRDASAVDEQSGLDARRSLEGGDSGARASPASRSRVDDERSGEEDRDRAVRRVDGPHDDSERDRGSYRGFSGDHRQHRGDAYDGRRRDDEYNRPNHYHGGSGGYDDCADGRDRHFRAPTTEFRNDGAFQRRHSRSRSPPRDDRDRGGHRDRDFDGGGGHRDRDFGRGRDGGYFDNGSGGGGGGGRYGGGANGYDNRYGPQHQHQQQQQPPRHPHHAERHDRDRSFQRHDGDGYRSRPY